MINFYNIEVSEGEITEPVTLDEAKAFAMVDHADQDTLLTSILLSARQDVEELLGIKLVESSVVAHVSTTKCNEELWQLPKAFKVTSADNVVVKSLTNGEPDDLQTLNEDYYLNGALTLSNSGRFTIAYDLVPIVPEAVKEAIKMLVAYRYDNRGDQSAGDQQGWPEDLKAKLSQYRQIWL